MANKVIWVGIGLSGLGLGYFLPVVLPFGALVLVSGVILLLLDK